MDERRGVGIGSEGVLVRPGEMALATDGSKLVSVVGIGVAVCLWSPADRIAALAHFVEPSTRDPSRATPRYGNVAVPELVRMVRESGSCQGLEAQLFGACDEEPGDPRAMANAEIALRVLASRSVPVVSRDLGGGKGRKIVFDGGSGQVAVLKVHRLRQEDRNP